MPPRFQVFLSHNSADKPAVEELAHRLHKEGIEPWLDKWHLIPGDPWQPALEDALKDCECCAVFIGSSGMGTWQHEEMRAAINHRVRDSLGRFRVLECEPLCQHFLRVIRCNRSFRWQVKLLELRRGTSAATTARSSSPR